VDLSQCDRGYLLRRYAASARLKTVPPLETLESIEHHRHYSGGLSILELTVGADGTRMKNLGFQNPGVKIQYATIFEDSLLLALQDGVILVDRFADLSDPMCISIGAPGRIDDPWFAGVHSCCVVDRNTCVVAASAPDAVLWVDIRGRRVTRRVRLPAELYGRNYSLEPTTDLRRNFVHNDLQIAHINWAWPYRDAVYVTSLIPGDVGRFDKDGSYHRLVTGFVGCHGVRVSAERGQIYFSDSCRGSLVLCSFGGEIQESIGIDSKWLHDTQHVIGDLFLFCAADRNRLDLIDIQREKVLLSHDFGEVGDSVQFLSVVPAADTPKFLAS
jgi:hypothetical protein